MKRLEDLLIIQFLLLIDKKASHTCYTLPPDKSHVIAQLGQCLTKIRWCQLRLYLDNGFHRISRNDDQPFVFKEGRLAGVGEENIQLMRCLTARERHKSCTYANNLRH